MARAPKKDKDPCDALPEQWRNDVASKDLVALKAELADVAKKEFANQASKAADEDLNRLKDQVKEASLGYNDLSKEHKLKLKFIIRNLADKGDLTAQTIIQLYLSAEDQKA